jgi:hypothetical protein
MAGFRTHRPVLLITAVFSRYPDAFEWARECCERHWGPVALASERFAFVETPYYEKTMGPGLDQSNDWEEQCAREHAWPEPRPLNLDPGYVTEAKLILASTKDRDHRIYLSDGVFAEQTLHYHRGQWQPREWTYPNYRRADYHQFFDRCRAYLRERYADEPSR